MIAYLKKSGIPAILALNKIDQYRREEIAEKIAAYAAKHDFSAFVPISAKKGEMTDANVSTLEDGIDISVRKMAKTQPASLEIIERTTLGRVADYLDDANRKIALSRPDLPAFIGKLTITEGKKHQVKRMIRHFGAKVVYLRRVTLGGVPLDESLPEGSYRELAPSELAILKK